MINFSSRFPDNFSALISWNFEDFVLAKGLLLILESAEGLAIFLESVGGLALFLDSVGGSISLLNSGMPRSHSGSVSSLERDTGLTIL